MEPGTAPRGASINATGDLHKAPTVAEVPKEIDRQVPTSNLHPSKTPDEAGATPVNVYNQTKQPAPIRPSPSTNHGGQWFQSVPIRPSQPNGDGGTIGKGIREHHGGSNSFRGS